MLFGLDILYEGCVLIYKIERNKNQRFTFILKRYQYV